MRQHRAGQSHEALLVITLIVGLILLAVVSGLWYVSTRRSAQVAAQEHALAETARREAEEALAVAEGAGSERSREESLASSTDGSVDNTGTAAETPMARLGWLAGSWFTSGSGGEEHWLPVAGGLMLGMNRSVDQSGGTFFEFMRIEELPEGIVFFASPGGREATPFPMIEQSDGHVVFENLANDFPQRVIYERGDANTLRAHIEGQVQGEMQQQQWEWVRGSIRGP